MLSDIVYALKIVVVAILYTQKINKNVFCHQYLDENKDYMINFKEFVWILGVVCKGELAARLKLLYQLHQPPALLGSESLEIETPKSTYSGKWILIINPHINSLKTVSNSDYYWSG